MNLENFEIQNLEVRHGDVVFLKSKERLPAEKLKAVSEVLADISEFIKKNKGINVLFCVLNDGIVIDKVLTGAESEKFIEEKKFNGRMIRLGKIR